MFLLPPRCLQARTAPGAAFTRPRPPARHRYSLSHRVADALPNGTIVKSKTTIERARFFRDDGVWQYAEYQLAELPDSIIQKAKVRGGEA